MHSCGSLSSRFYSSIYPVPGLSVRFGSVTTLPPGFDSNISSDSMLATTIIIVVIIIIIVMGPVVSLPFPYHLTEPITGQATSNCTDAADQQGIHGSWLR